MFSLVLPCYNEAPSLEALSDRVLAGVRRRQLGPSEFRLILVNNGSTDESQTVMEKLKAGPAGPYLDIVRVPVNQGYGFGVLSGLRAAAPGFVGWTHADEQCDPEDAFRAWEIARAEAKPVLVKGGRYGRRLGEWLFSRGFELSVLLILRRWIPEINAQPKIFPSTLLASLSHPPKDFAFDLYVLLKAREAGFRFITIPVRFPPRPHGQSRWAATLRSKLRTILGFYRYLLQYRG